MIMCVSVRFFFFCKQKTAYEMRISDWSSDVCSSDLKQPVIWFTATYHAWRPTGLCGKRQTAAGWYHHEPYRTPADPKSEHRGRADFQYHVGARSVLQFAITVAHADGRQDSIS